MARHPVYPDSKPAEKKKAPVKKKAAPIVETPVLPPRSFEATVRDLEQQATAVRMKVEGYSHPEIAAALKVSVARVPSLLANGLEEYREKRNKAVEKYFALHTRRYDVLLQKWMPRALGAVVQVKNEDGAIVDATIPPDPEAARVVATYLRDAARMFGFNKLRVEHTGAHGGPIVNVNANIDWSRATDEQLAQAAAGNPEVLRLLSGASPGGGSARDASSDEGEDGSPNSRH